MKKGDFDRLRVGDIVWTNFSNSYRRCQIARKEERHAIVIAPAVRGNKNLERRARYKSLDLTQRHKTSAELVAYREEQRRARETS